MYQHNQIALVGRAQKALQEVDGDEVHIAYLASYGRSCVR